MSISSLLNDIISNGSNATTTVVNPSDANVSFDKDKEKDKLAFGVIKDMTKAMMADDVPDESMVDSSLMDHIQNDYKSTPFGYLNDAKNRLKSPLLESLVEAIEDTVIQEEADFKEKGYVSDNHKISSDILEGNPDYQTFRDKLAKETSNMVVNDVSSELLKSNQAPDFSNIDNKIKPVSKNEATPEGGEEEPVTEEEQELPTTPVEENMQTESAIINMSQTIVTESYAAGKPMTTEQGMEKAICEYCVQQLCFLLKDTSISPFDKLLK